jgi:hypothetical protein
MLNWSGSPQPRIADIRSALELRSPFLRRRGVRSVAFLPDEGECAAVMVASCADEETAATLAAAIEPAADVRVESMLFEDDPGTPARLQKESVPPLPRGAARSLLEAIATG